MAHQTCGHTGFYGKLPWAGDFVQRRLPDDLVQHWDAHMCAVMPGLSRWADGSASPWAFLCAPPACGHAAFAGVLAPSRDRVGRRFPLLLARVLPPDGNVLLVPGLPWFDAAWRLQLAVAQGAVMDTEDLEQRIKAVDACATEAIDGAQAPSALQAQWQRCQVSGGSVWWRDACSLLWLPTLPDAQLNQPVCADQQIEVKA